MAQVIEVDSLWSDYHSIVKTVVADGDSVSPRGMGTYELRDVAIVMHDPRAALPTGCGRKLVPAIGVAEALQLIGGVSTPELLTRITPNFRRFLNDDGSQHGAYGLRTVQQMPHLIDRLREDPDTRQGIVGIWQPQLDWVEPVPRDVPCTLNLVFSIRDGALLLTTIMRSNDVWWGLAYDAYQFSQLQLTVARCLGLRCGPYTHVANSLHIYHRDLGAAAALHPPVPSSVAIGHGIGCLTEQPWDHYVERARSILMGTALEPACTEELWMAEQIKKHL